MDATSIIAQINNVQQKASGLPKGSSRVELLDLAHQLVSSLETPAETVQRIGWAEPALLACLRTATDLRLFAKLSSHSAEGASVEQLARETSTDEALMARLLRHLAANNVVREASIGKFASTSLTDQLVAEDASNGIVYCHDICHPAFNAIPAYLKKTAYRNPTDAVNGPFQEAHKCSGTHFFPYLENHPPYLGVFGSWLGKYRAGRQSWTDRDSFFPVTDKLTIQSNESDSALIVDVGGGFGQDLKALLQSYPSIGSSGRVILQDKPEVISSLDEHSLRSAGIEPQAHDFFTPQPVHEARAYHLHSILHDWPDDDCVRILEALKSALKPGYSKILINELIVPDKGAHQAVTTMDWLMMALGSVRERTESEFAALVQRTGLVVAKVWQGPPGSEGLIEVVL